MTGADIAVRRAHPAHRRIRVLITSAGRRVELLRCFRRDAAELGLDVELLACDLEPRWSAACQDADRSFGVPPYLAADYVEAILALCREHAIDLVVPTVDPELQPLSDARGAFAALGSRVAVSGPATIEIARDKRLTARHLTEHGLPVPRTVTPEEVLAAPEAWTWPVLVKPRHGSAGRAVHRVSSPAALGQLTIDEPVIVQTLLRGPEHTINLFVDRGGRLRAVVPHLRRRVRAGEVEKAVTVRDRALMALGERVAAALPEAYGALCFQTMCNDDGMPVVFEINARFGGGFPVAHRAGAPFTRWLLQEVAGLVPAQDCDWIEGVAMLRYDAAIFLEPR